MSPQTSRRATSPPEDAANRRADSRREIQPGDLSLGAVCFGGSLLDPHLPRSHSADPGLLASRSAD